MIIKIRSVRQVRRVIVLSFLICASVISVSAQTMNQMWDSQFTGQESPSIQWFKNAKFGLFIHWGLYSQLGGEWKGKRYYGSGEWLMAQAQIPAKDYAAEAETFNPVHFNANDWVELAKESGARYMVVTAKHHEGFAMFDSKVSDFSIVKASPYKKDLMKALSDAANRKHLPFGFYYSQFLDWHEPNGGGNNWDFKGNKDYMKYYNEKSIPQLKELMTQYGKLGMVWFDMPGGLTKEQTKQLVDSLHRLQPQCLFSSRVGQGLGDYMDFGDSEMPAKPIKNAWEAIYTFNDSWGYIRNDLNFKTPAEIICLLAQAASKGGNLMLNIGPDGKGGIPPICMEFLKATGKWLHLNGESIYNTTYGFVPAQPWGVTTSKPGKLFVHVFNRPYNKQLLIPGFLPKAIRISTLSGNMPVKWTQRGSDVFIQLPAKDPGKLEKADEVFVIDYSGKEPAYDSTLPITISSSFAVNELPSIQATLSGGAKISTLTFSHYFGDWKHVTCIADMKTQIDHADFKLRITQPGYYKLSLDYACSSESSGQEGMVNFNGQGYFFRTLRTVSQYDVNVPVMFIKHSIAVVKVSAAGVYTLSIHPVTEGNELFKLKTVLLEPFASEAEDLYKNK